jgi:30S ribosomal protein S31
MGKGDKKTRKGKIVMGTFGVTRPHKKKKTEVPKTKAKAKAKPKAKPAAKPKAKAKASD